MVKKVFGINIAVKDLDTAVKKFEAILGMKPRYSKPEEFAFPGLKGAGFSFKGVNIALVASDDENSVISKFIKNRGEGVLLISLETDDVDSDVERLRTEALQFVLPENTEGKFGKVNFIHPKSLHGVQLELLQPSADFNSMAPE